MVLLDHEFNALEIYEAQKARDRDPPLKKPGSIARNVRGALSVSSFQIYRQTAMGTASW